MCELEKARITINLLLNETIGSLGPGVEKSEEDVVAACVAALQAAYAGLCSDEAIEKKARSFAASFLLSRSRLNGAHQSRFAA